LPISELTWLNPRRCRRGSQTDQLGKAIGLHLGHHIRPVMRGETLVAIVTRSDLLRAVASLTRDVPGPTADDDHIRHHVVASIEKNEWQPTQLVVTVRDGIVYLSGMITDERFRQAAIVALENVSGV
jgi:hypothetical protein